MKFFLLSSLIAFAGASSSTEHAALRGSENLSPRRAELLAKWEGDAAVAEYLQIAIKEGRTYHQCTQGCEDAKDNDRNFNRGRCIKGCGKISDEGNDTNQRTSGCADCKMTYRFDSNGYRRCMTGCRAGQESTIDACSSAVTCADCRRDCGNGMLRDDCLDCNNCPGGPGLQCRDFGNDDVNNDNSFNDNGFNDDNFSCSNSFCNCDRPSLSNSQRNACRDFRGEFSCCDDNNDDNNNDNGFNNDDSFNCSNSFCNCDRPSLSNSQARKCRNFRGEFDCCNNEEQPKDEQPVEEE